MDALLRELRFGIRMLLKRPGLSLAVIVTFGLGLGIGLFSVEARDPAVFGAVVLTLALIGLAASFIPARRVTRVDPVIALGAE